MISLRYILRKYRYLVACSSPITTGSNQRRDLYRIESTHKPGEVKNEVPQGYDPWSTGEKQAGGRGFEPRHTDPESAVLPLDEPPALNVGDCTMIGQRGQFGEARGGLLLHLCASGAGISTIVDKLLKILRPGV